MIIAEGTGALLLHTENVIFKVSVCRRDNFELFGVLACVNCFGSGAESRQRKEKSFIH